ncbi:MAG: IS110 family transposase, partial [Coriobacteriia bacterium]|nr:IS110 family transposase [Coriobacteriia bacterium]
MAETQTGVIIGVDTHKRLHVVAVISPHGQRLDVRQFEAHGDGYKAALAWVKTYGTPLRAGIEGSSSYGVGISRFLRANDIAVFDVYAPNKQDRRRRGKDDAIDAFQAAEAALTFERCAPSKDNDAAVEAARLLESTYQQAVKQRTATINALKAALLILPDQTRSQLEGMSTKELVNTCARYRITDQTDAGRGIKMSLRSMAKRIISLNSEIASLNAAIEQYAADLLSATTSLLGVGAHGAIRLLCSAGQNIERLKSESSFAMLCGVSPIPASSGNTHRHRLNRGGDRKANCVLHMMVLTRQNRCEKTKEYIIKRMSEGKSKKDAVRSLKR